MVTRLWVGQDGPGGRRSRLQETWPILFNRFEKWHTMVLSYPKNQPSPTLTSDYLSPPRITQTTQFTLGPLTLIPSQTTRTTLDPLTSVPPQTTWIIRTIRPLGLSMTLYGLLHLDSIVLLSCHSLNLTCTRLILRNPVSMPLGSSGTTPHSFLWILYLPTARTSTFPEHTAFGLRTLPLYCTI